jgi:hypothetical protein
MKALSFLQTATTPPFILVLSCAAFGGHRSLALWTGMEGAFPRICVQDGPEFRPLHVLWLCLVTVLLAVPQHVPLAHPHVLKHIDTRSSTPSRVGR